MSDKPELPGKTGRPGKKGDRFRRPRFDAPRDAEETQLPVPASRSAHEIGMFLKPLHDLSETFRDNSDALRSLAEGQARLAKRMERSDRSEAVIRSTEALNDTFRGVQRTQERLMTRLDVEGKRPWLLALGVLGAVAVLVGGGLWFFLDSLEKKDRDSADDRRETIAAIVSGHDETVLDLQRQLRESGEALSRQMNLTDEQRDAYSSVAADLEKLEKENAELLQDRSSLSGALRDANRLRTEGERLTTELDRSGRELAAARRRIVEIEADLEDRDRRLKEMARSAVSASPAAPRAAEGEEDVGPAVPDEHAAVPVGASKDPPELTRIVSVLNKLLASSRTGESYEFSRIGGVRGKTLYDVVVLNRDETGKEVKRMEAVECRVVVDTAQKRAELRFRNGHIVYYGVKAPFWGGQYVVPVSGIDPSSWHRSGLLFLDEAR